MLRIQSKKIFALIRTTFKKTIFTGFEDPALLFPVKNRVLEICSNIFLTLICFNTIVLNVFILCIEINLGRSDSVNEVYCSYILLGKIFANTILFNKALPKILNIEEPVRVGILGHV